MLLCLDFGNTRKKAVLYQDKKIIEHFILDLNTLDILNKILNKFKPQKSILSSVIKHDIAINELLIKYTQFIYLDHTIPIPIFPCYTKLDSMGADRIALAVATQNNNAEDNNLIISLGTCITYNFINSKKMFLGGSISPGVQIRFKSMNDYTNLLPLVLTEYDFPLIGYDTKTNLLSGVLLGVVKEIDGIIDEYKCRYKKLNCVLTGGDSQFFAKQLKNKIFVDNDYLFKGLYAIMEYAKF